MLRMQHEWQLGVLPALVAPPFPLPRVSRHNLQRYCKHGE